MSLSLFDAELWAGGTGDWDKLEEEEEGEEMKGLFKADAVNKEASERRRRRRRRKVYSKLTQ